MNISVCEQARAEPSTSGRILIVEDDAKTARSLSTILERAGYATTVCLNGIGALRSAGEVVTRAAVVDIHLPDLSGLVITQKLREQLGPRVPIIVLSGDTSMETLNSLAHVGASYFLSKPTTSAVLLKMLGDCLLDAARKAC